MANPFDYRKPTTEEAMLMSELSALMKLTYESIVQNVAPSAERTLAVRKLQEARMWVNVAILGIDLAEKPIDDVVRVSVPLAMGEQRRTLVKDDDPLLSERPPH